MRLCWLAGAVFIGLGAAQAHQGATGLLKERMDAMESLEQGMKKIRCNLVGAWRFSRAVWPGAAELVSSVQRARRSILERREIGDILEQPRRDVLVHLRDDGLHLFLRPLVVHRRDDRRPQLG
jgi:hypothetical protein